jgi:uncharacterized protein (TIGR02328 family)
MRLWHKDLIEVLPRKQLIAQWRECCAICSNLASKGTPNHLLVNKIMDYPSVHFMEYTRLVISEIIRRNYKVKAETQNIFCRNFKKFGDPNETIIGANSKRVLFENWHNERYLKQCLYNLQEKYDCGGISKEEWERITDNFGGVK